MAKELLFDAVRKVGEHLPEFEKASGRTWRIGDTTLGTPDVGNKTRSSKGGFIDDRDDNLGQLLESGLAHVEKISLVADVTLKTQGIPSPWTGRRISRNESHLLMHLIAVAPIRADECKR